MPTRAKRMPENKDVLVALLRERGDFSILQTEGWYRIPVAYRPTRWPPRLIAFYQGKVFCAEDAYKIRYFGSVDAIDIVPRKELLPHDERNQHKAENLYFRVQIKRLMERETPILSFRPRRLVFIPTTMRKFKLAEQINDLFDESQLEDKVWTELKQRKILAERQWKVVLQEHSYRLDFAIFCRHGKLAVETDGYTTHYGSEDQIDYDTWRQNEIEIDDWRFLHYTPIQIRDESTPYLDQIQTKIEQLGGLERPEDFKRKVGEEQAEYLIDEDDYD